MHMVNRDEQKLRLNIAIDKEHAPQGDTVALEVDRLERQLEEKGRQIERSQILKQQAQSRVEALEGEVGGKRQSLWTRVRWWGK